MPRKIPLGGGAVGLGLTPPSQPASRSQACYKLHSSVWGSVPPLERGINRNMLVKNLPFHILSRLRASRLGLGTPATDLQIPIVCQSRGGFQHSSTWQMGVQYSLPAPQPGDICMAQCIAATSEREECALTHSTRIYGFTSPFFLIFRLL